MWLTEKRREELYDELVQRARQRLRSLEPRSQASRIYPHLSTDDQRREIEKRKSQPKEK